MGKTQQNLGLDFLTGDEPTEEPEIENNESELSDLATGFLKDVPPEDAEIVAKYVKTWDANVTKAFQEKAAATKEYEELGQISELQAAVNLVNYMQEDPGAFIKDFKTFLNENGIEITEEEMDQVEKEISSNLPEFEGVPEELVELIKGVKSQLDEVNTWRQETTASQEEQEALAAIDEVLEKMHNTHGDFDNGFILAQLMEHGDEDKAIEAWNNLIQSVKDSQTNAPRAPKVLSQGSTPLDQVDREKLKDQDARIKFGAEYLMKAQRG